MLWLIVGLLPVAWIKLAIEWNEWGNRSSPAYPFGRSDEFSTDAMLLLAFTVGYYNAAMPPTDNPKKRSRSGPIAAAVLFAVLVLYPLSTGPAQALASRGLISEDAAMLPYLPLQWVYVYLPTKVQRALDWYDNLWGAWPSQG